MKVLVSKYGRGKKISVLNGKEEAHIYIDKDGEIHPDTWATMVRIYECDKCGERSTVYGETIHKFTCEDCGGNCGIIGEAASPKQEEEAAY